MLSSNAIPLRSYQKKAALAAVVLMGAFLVFMSVMRGTIKTEAAAVRRLNGTKLALIGHEEKNRKDIDKAIGVSTSTISRKLRKICD